MSITILIFLCLLAVAFYLFSREVFPLEISALLVLLLLIGTGILTRYEAFSSFGNESLVLIGSLFIMIAGLRKTGIIRTLEQQLAKAGRGSRMLSFALLLFIVAAVSAFVSNTATLAVTIPIAVSVAHSFGDSPRRWLMPIAFASVLGGMNSLIGTSTNIIISTLLPRYNLEEFHLFTTASVGLPILALGFLYLLFFAPRLISGGSAAQDVGVKYNLRGYTAEVTVLETSPLCNKSLAESPLFREADITVLGVERDEQPLMLPRASLLLLPDDRLVVEGNIEKLTDITDRYGLKFSEELKVLPSPPNEPEARLRDRSGSHLELHEVLVTSRSILNNRTPASVALRNRYRISLIAINRYGRTLRNKLSDVRMASGDILVVQFVGPIDSDTLDFLGLVPLQRVTHERFRTSKAPWAAVIFIGSLLVGSATAAPLSVACLAGAVLLVMGGILRADEIYESVDWRVLLFIGAVLSLGRGMEASGTAAFLADALGTLFAGFPPHAILAFFFLLTMVMTNLLSNQATAVVMVPLAVNAAQTLGVAPMPLVMAVTIASSCCFVTPFEPAFMLVYGPGGYKFSDFFKLGITLNVIAAAVAIVIIPIWWPLQ